MVNREWGMARHAFNFAMKEWAVGEPQSVYHGDPGKRTQKRGSLAAGRRGTALLAACPAWLRKFVEFAVETGFRLGEILPHQSPHVDLDQARLTVDCDDEELTATDHSVK